MPQLCQSRGEHEQRPFLEPGLQPRSRLPAHLAEFEQSPRRHQRRRSEIVQGLERRLRCSRRSQACRHDFEWGESRRSSSPASAARDPSPLRSLRVFPECADAVSVRPSSARASLRGSCRIRGEDPQMEDPRRKRGRDDGRLNGPLCGWTSAVQ